MRVLFTTYGAASHLFAMVPLAWALRVAGHEVRVGAAPSFAAEVTATGLPATALGHDVDPGEAWRGFEVTGPDHEGQRTARTMAMFHAASDAMADDVIRAARGWGADLIASDPREYAGPLAARVLGVPSARVLYGVDHTYAQRHAEWPLLAPLWRRFGLRRVDADATVTVDPCPPRLGPSAAPGVLAARYVPYNGTAAVPRLKPPARPRVLVTWGASFGATAGHLDPVQVILRALADLDVEVLLAVAPGQRSMLRDVPAGVRVLTSLPLHLVLASCAAVVHQGGAGATLTAAACGTPQLVVAVKGDQLVNAEHVTAAGAGRAIAYPALDAPGVREAVGALLHDARHTAAARELAAQIRARPGPADVARALAGLVPA